MKDFVVLFKPIEVPVTFDSKHLYFNYMQMDYLLQEMMKNQNSIGLALDIKTNYVIDEKSINFQTINGKLCVVCIAHHKWMPIKVFNNPFKYTFSQMSLDTRQPIGNIFAYIFKVNFC